MDVQRPLHCGTTGLAAAGSGSLEENISELIRVLVVEDHHIVRQGIVALLGTVGGIEVVGEAVDGIEAIEQFAKHEPDVTLLDLRMPRMRGVEVIRNIRAKRSKARFVVLTISDSDEDISGALRAGASAYLLKGVTASALVETIQAVYAGRLQIPPDVAQRFSERKSTKELTPRELNVLEEIVRGKSNEEIAAELKISMGTVRTHISGILDKLGATSRTQAAVTGILRGIVPIDTLKETRT
jgi:DNA-binding NarL/FixJ family response regulator